MSGAVGPVGESERNQDGLVAGISGGAVVVFSRCAAKTAQPAVSAMVVGQLASGPVAAYAGNGTATGLAARPLQRRDGTPGIRRCPSLWPETWDFWLFPARSLERPPPRCQLEPPKRPK
jgi:hypothetical protein